MKKPKGEVWFLASCVELYKNQKGMSGQDAYNHLRKTGAVDFITDCWDGLHTTSPPYIIGSIDEYIQNHANVQ
ncbi:MAG: DUF3791 domain-containing protein [Oscillospiraceae bacterium]|nr:DUF3791 domain-containing protein [Oscillospiraceae bacterium]